MRKRIADILLVEGDPTLRYSVAFWLRRENFNVDIVSTASEAIKRIKNQGYSLLITSIELEGMTGLDLLEALRQHDLDLPTITTYGESDEAVLERLQRLGIEDILAKPCAGEELLETVNRMLCVA